MKTRASYFVWMMGFLGMMINSGCNKKKSTETPTSSTAATTTTAETSSSVEDGSVRFSGNLALSLGLLASEFDLLQFELTDGEASAKSKPKVIAVAADGSFSADIEQSSGADGIDKYLDADGTVDRDLVKADNPGSEAQIDAMSDEELIEALQHEGEDEDGGNGRTSDKSFALVLRNKTLDATDKMGSLVAFVGIPSGSGALLGMRPEDMKSGSTLDLGNLDSSGLSTAELSSFSDQFQAEDNLSTAKEIARTNRSLQGLANVYANSDPDKGTSWDFTPFFTFQGQLADIKDAFNEPAGYEYQNMGVYISVDDEDALTFENVCGGSKGLLKIIPPADASYDSVTISPTHPITNALVGDVTTSSTSYSTTSQCATSSNENGMLFVRHFSSEENRFLFNTTIDGTPPAGIWKVEYEGTRVAQFNLSPAAPLDSSGNPLVYIPAVKITVGSNGVISGVDVKFYVYEGGQYVAVTDLEGFKKVVTQVTYSFYDSDGKTSDTTSLETNESFDFPESGAVFSASQMSYEFIFADQTDDESKYRAESINISYDMYGNRYRFDFRAQN